jgi:creatinine amidohydrolase
VNELARMTTVEAERALVEARMAIVAVGSLEQHGPHLALDTDTAVADAIAVRITEELGAAAVLCPTIGYGLSEHHLGFAGTLTLRPETFIAVLHDLCESLAHHGVRRVLVVNGHGGNIDALRLAARNARRDLGMLVASVMWATIAADEASALATGRVHGHACEVETSVVLALAPDRVRRDPAEVEPGGRSSVDPLTDPPRATVDEPVWFHEWTTDGALGDPRMADEDAGRRLVDVVVQRAVAFAWRLAERDLPEEER